MLSNKVEYLLQCVQKSFSQRHQQCPSCGSPGPAVLDRKYGVTQLRRCSGCKLLYRTPTTSAEESALFYNENYSEGFTTERPTLEQLSAWKANHFQDTEKNYQHYLAVLRALEVQRGSRLYDYGCSWGYGSYQFSHAGYGVDSFEISQSRADFAKQHLGVQIVPPELALAESYDVFFSAHVIEHLPQPSSIFTLAERLLKPGGLFIAFTPNGSEQFRQRAPRDWHLMWGQSHPQLVDVEYLEQRFYGVPKLIHSAPLCSFHQAGHIQPVIKWQAEQGTTPLCLDHVELVFAYRKTLSV
jgi:2-polyprenyl-3-methyl-5-hydroxy-6-metoxy-1,4-benzoquinol methylase